MFLVSYDQNCPRALNIFNAPGLFPERIVFAVIVCVGYTTLLIVLARLLAEGIIHIIITIRAVDRLTVSPSPRQHLEDLEVNGVLHMLVAV